MITFHTSANGAADYLDFGDFSGTRYYLSRAEARRLAAEITAATAADVICGGCDRRNGVHSTECPYTKPATTKRSNICAACQRGGICGCVLSGPAVTC